MMPHNSHGERRAKRVRSTVWLAAMSAQRDNRDSHRAADRNGTKKPSQREEDVAPVDEPPLREELWSR